MPAPHLSVVVAQLLLLPGLRLHLQHPAVVQRSRELAQSSVHHQPLLPGVGEGVEGPGGRHQAAGRPEHVLVGVSVDRGAGQADKVEAI